MPFSWTELSFNRAQVGWFRLRGDNSADIEDNGCQRLQGKNNSAVSNVDGFNKPPLALLPCRDG